MRRYSYIVILYKDYSWHDMELHYHKIFDLAVPHDKSLGHLVRMNWICLVLYSLLVGKFFLFFFFYNKLYNSVLIGVKMEIQIQFDYYICIS